MFLYVEGFCLCIYKWEDFVYVNICGRISTTELLTDTNISSFDFSL